MLRGMGAAPAEAEPSMNMGTDHEQQHEH